jgi:hypothetical protein
MRVALTIPTAGAGKWAWYGWANAFEFFGWEVNNLNLFHNTEVHEDVDLVICTTSQPRDDIIRWRKNNPSKRLALNVLAWTDEALPCIHNAGVQATHGNFEYASALNPDIVFAQYSPKWRDRLLDKWTQNGFRLGSMEMAADAVVYPYLTDEPNREVDVFYSGGRWPYKAQNIDNFLLPVFQKFPNSKVVGRGWPFATTDMDEKEVGYNFRHAKVCPNIHEPHSTLGGYDVVERVFKVLYCGGLCISDYVLELESGFGLTDAVHLFESPSPQSYLKAINEAIRDNKAFDCVREQGQKYVALNHTYFNRVANLLLDMQMMEEYEKALEKLLLWQKKLGINS